MKTLRDYILESDEDKEQENGINSEEENNDLDNSDEIRQTIITPQDTSIDIALVGEIRLFSDQSEIYRNRKEAIADKFRNRADLSTYNSDRISSSKIVELYVDALIKGYKNYLDRDIKALNISSKKELKRQIADDIIILIKTTRLNYK